MRDLPFSKASIVLLLSMATALFALSIILSAYDHAPTSSGTGEYRPGSYSTSALGYAGLYEVLKQMGHPVARGLGNAQTLVGSSGTLIVTEPELWRLNQDDNRKLLQVPRLLLVLPKWKGYRSESNPAWIARAKMEELLIVQGTLALVETRGEIVRMNPPKHWSVNRAGFEPQCTGQMQLMRSGQMTPVVAVGEAMLVGEIKDGSRTIWVVSDPDVLSNHGLLKGSNAAFAVALIDGLRTVGNNNLRAPIVFDESVHGYLEATDSFLKMMFRMPFVALTILIILAAALLFWAGAGRFGAPRPFKPPLDFGKGRLIDNSARLLDYSGHHSRVLKRYVRMVIRSVAETLHAPAGLDSSAQAAWLDQIGRVRGVRKSCREIGQSAADVNDENPRDLARLFECAWDIYNWKGEMLNGSAKSRRHNKRHSD